MRVYLHKNKYSLFLFLELFILMPYQYIKILPYVYSATVYLKFAALTIEILLFFMLSKENRNDMRQISMLDLSYIVYIIYICTVSFFKNSLSVTNILSLGAGLLLCFFAIRRSFYDSHERATRTISLYFLFAIVLNFVSMILFPEGLYTSTTALGSEYINFFLGVDNAFGMVLFPAATYCLYEFEKYEKHSFAKSLVLLGMILYMYIVTASAAGLCAIIVLIAIFVLYKLDLFKRILSVRFIVVAMIIVSVVLISGNALLYTNSFLSDFITDALGKDITFSSRTIIWNKGLVTFFQNPIFGQGKFVSDNVIYIWGAYRLAHNFFLQILIEGGVVGIGLFLWFVNSIAVDEKKAVQDNKPIQVFDLGIIATMCYLLMESGNYTFFVFALLLVMGYACKTSIDITR